MTDGTGPSPAAAVEESVSVGGPLVPTPEVKTELEALLEKDDSVLGEVWRRLRAGHTDAAIQQARGTEAKTFVWNYKRRLSALLDGDLPSAPSVIEQVASSLRSFSRKPGLSSAAAETINHNLEVLASQLAAKRGDAGRRVEPKPAADVFSQLSQMRMAEREGGHWPHKPLLLLWNLARLVGDPEADRFVAFSTIEPGYSALFGEVTQGQGSPSFEEPFWRLQNDGNLWTVPERMQLSSPAGTNPPTKTLLVSGSATGGFATELDVLARDGQESQSRLARAMLLKLDEEFRERAIAALGLRELGLLQADYAPAGLQSLIESILEALQRRTAPSSRAVIRQLVESDMPAQLAALLPTGFHARGSSEMGNQAEVPWVSVFAGDAAGSARRGYYPVYLFAADGSAAFLTIASATDSVRSMDFIRKRTIDLLTAGGPEPGLSRSINLQSQARAGRPKRYEASVAYSLKYGAAGVPDDSTLSHNLGRFIGIWQRIVDSGLELEQEEVLHLVLKWSADYQPDTMDRVRKIAEDRGRVWWGNRGQIGTAAIAKAKLQKLNKQLENGIPTHAYLYQKSDSWRADLLQISTDFEGIDQHLVPDYLESEDCNAWFLLQNLQQEPPTWPAHNLLVASSPEPLFTEGALGNQTSPILVYERSIPSSTDGIEPSPGGEVDEVSLTLDWLSRSTLWDSADLDALARALDRTSVILSGPPGTGKTWVAKHLARYVTDDEPLAHKVVQFHPSYGYEEFVEGLRPVIDGGALVFKHVGGTVLQMSERARELDGPCVLVIDEFNRANLPRVMGELMFALENRDQPIDLLHTKGFELPSNLRFIGTMNTADRSTRAIDVALRRRFEVFECAPSSTLLKKFFDSESRSSRVHGLVEGFEALNATLTGEIDRHHTIGHTFFMVDGIDRTRLLEIWNRQIRPLIDDYFFDQPDLAEQFTLNRFWPNLDAHD